VPSDVELIVEFDTNVVLQAGGKVTLSTGTKNKTMTYPNSQALIPSIRLDLP
jgi:hypothetical protein